MRWSSRKNSAHSLLPCLRICEELGDGRELQRRLPKIALRIGLVKCGRVLQHAGPRLRIDLQSRQRCNRLHGIGTGEVIYWLVNRELLELRLLRGQGLGRSLISLIRRQPDLVSQRQRVIVKRHKTKRTLTLSEIAVLLVIANANHYAQDPEPRLDVPAQSAEGRFSRILIRIDDPVFDVVGCRYLIQLQLRLGSLQLAAHRLQDGIRASQCLPVFLLGGGRRHKQTDKDKLSGDELCQVAGNARECHCVWPVPFPAWPEGVSVGGGRMGGRFSEWACFCTSTSENNMAGAAAATGTEPDSAPQTPLKTSVFSPVSRMRFNAASGVPTISTPRTSSSGRPST